MAKAGGGKSKAKKHSTGHATMPTEYKPPSPAAMMDMHADSMAHDVARNHPSYKKVHAGAKKAIKAGVASAMKQGPGGVRNVRSA